MFDVARRKRKLDNVISEPSGNHYVARADRFVEQGMVLEATANVRDWIALLRNG